MDDDQLNEERIIESWISNAAPWTNAIRRREIDSRLVTNAAIVDVIKQERPRTVLDIGCGEGWLARALAAEGIEVIGLDVVPELIQRAQEAGGGSFHLASFEEIASGRAGIAGQFAVCNFSLLGKEPVARLLGALPSLLGSHGVLIVQTVHPLMACEEGVPYRSGWREETWAGFRSQFDCAAPWYFRTLPDWTDLLRTSGFRLMRILEPLQPATAKPLSLILLASVPVPHLPDIVRAAIGA